MFDATVPFYDAIYAWKDYEEETRRLLALLRKSGVRKPARWLDVACGTGLHLAALPNSIHREGADASTRMLAIAKKRLRGVALHRADMRTLDLGRTFDVVSCLFSSVGYVRGSRELRRAVAAMARHVAPGGALAIEPWFSPTEWKTPSVHARLVDDLTLKICRMNSSGRRGKVSVMDMHHLVGTPEGVEHVVERHEMWLFTRAEYRAALRAAGLVPTFDAKGISGRGLWIGTRGAGRR